MALPSKMALHPDMALLAKMALDPRMALHLRSEMALDPMLAQQRCYFPKLTPCSYSTCLRLSPVRSRCLGSLRSHLLRERLLRERWLRTLRSRDWERRRPMAAKCHFHQRG